MVRAELARLKVKARVERADGAAKSYVMMRIIDAMSNMLSFV